MNRYEEVIASDYLKTTHLSAFTGFYGGITVKGKTERLKSP